MSARYGLLGAIGRDWLTYGGRILWHTDAAELEYLFPHGTRVARIPPDVPDELMMPVKDHPQMASVSWPLRREDFRAR